MTKRCKADQAGLTLIEVSVILSVLVVLAAFMIPSITRFMDEASAIEAQNDVQAIATGLVNFMKDTGQSPSNVAHLSEGAALAPVEVLAGPGKMPRLNRGQLESIPRGRVTLGMRRNLSLAASTADGWAGRPTGSLEDYLQVNGQKLSLKMQTAGFGWNGPYILSELGSDPWGNQYLVNVVFMGTEGGAGDSAGVERRAVFVLSAGANQILETPFSQPVSDALVYGDDIAVRIR